MSNLLNIGLTGLKASKISLKTTGHNLANVNTEGFSRQRLLQTSNNPVIKEGLIQGTGTRTVKVSRISDENVEKNLRNATSKYNFHNERKFSLSQVEDIFNEVDREGLNQIVTRFFNSFRELAVQPENVTVRSVVRDNAVMVVEDIHRIRQTLNNISRNLDKKAEHVVEEINQLMNQISTMNQKIQILEVSNQETGDYRDMRDLAVKRLSENFDIHTYTDNNGQFNVAIRNVGTIISGPKFQKLSTTRVNRSQSLNDTANSLDIFFSERPDQSLTGKFKGGRLSSLMKVRNEDIQRLQKSIDDIAFNLVSSVNAIHERGFVNRTIQMNQDENTPAMQDSKGKTTGIKFFRALEDKQDAGMKIELSEDVLADLTNIVTALEPNSPGDNRVSIAISKIQHQKIFDDGNATLEEKYLQSIADIGLQSSKARMDSEQAEGILNQQKTVRERISGVSIDEETANMVRYQHAYEASAKILKTADQMFNTVIGLLKR